MSSLQRGHNRREEDRERRRTVRCQGIGETIGRKPSLPGHPGKTKSSRRDEGRPLGRGDVRGDATKRQFPRFWDDNFFVGELASDEWLVARDGGELGAEHRA